MLGIRQIFRPVRLSSCKCILTNAFSTSGTLNNARVAVILSGCGVYDGSEIHEASACMVHLSRLSADIGIFAPDKLQMHTVNHIKGEPMHASHRNVLHESARIARGHISDLALLKEEDFQAVIFPGGFGAAKNLSNFATEGQNCVVDKDVERVLKEFHEAGKPIGLCCIAPVLAAKVLKKEPKIEVTVGFNEEQGGRWPYVGTADAIIAMGAVHVEKDVTEVHVDVANSIVTTPAYMCETNLYEIFIGIGKMVEAVLEMVKS